MKMSNSKLSKQGQVVSVRGTFTTAKTQLGRTKPSTGPRVGHSWTSTTVAKSWSVIHMRHSDLSIFVRLWFLLNLWCICYTTSKLLF